MNSTLARTKEQPAIWVEGPKVLDRLVSGLATLLAAKDRLVSDAYESQEDLKAIKAYQIPDQEALDLGQSVTADLKLKLKAFEEEKEKITKPLNELLKLIRLAYAPVISPLEEGEKILKANMASAYKRFQVEQTKALQTVSMAMRMGEVETAKKHMNEMPEAAMPKNMSIREIWKFEVSDITQIEDKYLMIVVNETAVQAAVDAGERNIPGFRVYCQNSVTIRQDKK